MAGLLVVLAGLLPGLACADFLPMGTGQLSWYTSQVDNTEHAYGIYVPAAPPPEGGHGYPAVFHGHGYGWGVSADFSEWQKQWAEGHGWVLININARGPNFYGGIGDVAVQEVVKDASLRFDLDPDRLYFTGVSMGGTGAYRQAVLHPDVFAAAAPVDGWTDYRLWHKKWYSRVDAPDAIEEFRRPLLESMSPLFWFDRLQWGALLCMISGRDTVVWPEEGLRMVRALQDAGDFDVQMVLNDNAGHGGSNDLQRIYQFFDSRRRLPNPTIFTISTTSLNYGKLYWGEVNRLHLLGVGGRLRVMARSRSVEALTSNLDEFRLALSTSPVAEAPTVEVWADGFPAYTGPPRALSFTALRSPRGELIGWTSAPVETAPAPVSLRKRAGLEGPLGEALEQPFLVAYGTTGDAEAVERHRREAEAFCRQWNDFNVHAQSVQARPESEVTPAELEQRSLVVFGTVESSRLLRSAYEQTPVPVEVREGEIVVRDTVRGDRHYRGAQFGAFLAYPNPLSDFCTYLVVCTGEWATHADGTARLGLGYDLEKLPWAYPDYVIFNTDQAQLPWVKNVNDKPPVTCYEAAYFVEAGYFDQQWRTDALQEPARYDYQRPQGVKRLHVGETKQDGAGARAKVVDELGQPVAAARVTVDLGDAARSAVTDEQGWAVFRPAGPGDFTVLNVMATGALYDWRLDVLSHSGWAQQGLAVRPSQFVTALQGGEAGEVQVQVANLGAAARTVAVELLPPSGRLQPAVQQLRLAPGETQTAAFWWHPHDLPPGRYPLVAQVSDAAATLSRTLLAEIGPPAPRLVVMGVQVEHPLGLNQLVVKAQLANAGAQTATEALAGYVMGLGLALPPRQVQAAPGTPVSLEWRVALPAGSEGHYEARVYVQSPGGSTKTCAFTLP
jgi:hypothetical protein